MEPIVALEIGAANCCAAVFRNGNVEMVPGSKGCFLTPSIVAFHRTGTVAGHQAREEMVDFPDRTIYASESLHAARVKTASYAWDDLKESVPYAVETDKYGEMAMTIGNIQIEPKRVIRNLIEHMMSQVRSYIKKDITDVVMCIPPKTSFKRRKMLKEAAQEKGVTVTRFVTSTVAAALRVAFDRRNAENKKNFLVVDMGASHLTVAVVALGDEILENVATENVDFGGDALDAKIMKSLLPVNKEVFSSPSALIRLRKAIHLAKIELSSLFARTDSAEIVLEDLLPGFTLKDKIRDSTIKMEFVAGGCKLSNLLDDALKSSKLSECDIDEILLIGGSSGLKNVRSAVQDKFPGKPVNEDKVGHMWSVTGAAVQMAILKDCLGEEWPQKPLVLDKLNLKIGYENLKENGEIVPVLSPKTDIPTKVEAKIKNLRSTSKINVYDCTNGVTTTSGAEFLACFDVAKVVQAMEDCPVSDKDHLRHRSQRCSDCDVDVQTDQENVFFYRQRLQTE